MINVGITGQPGFVGTHLYNELGLFSDSVVRIPFEDSFFESEAQLRAFVKQCDLVNSADDFLMSQNGMFTLSGVCLQLIFIW